MTVPLTFFRRGPGPLVSVLIPTRGRVPHLLRAIDSLVSLAEDKKNLEFIFKVDDDDKETIDACKKLETLIVCKTIISPRGRGFHEMHEWVNQMCAYATGDWLFLFNDDAKVVVQNWDSKVFFCGTDKAWPGIDDICLIVAPTVDRPFAQEFILLRKATYELLGHFSLSPHNDNWIYGVMNFCGCVIHSDIFIEHYSHVIGDETRQLSEAAYKTTGKSLNSLEAKRLRVADIDKVLSGMETATARRDLAWLNNPVGYGWYWWKLDSGEIKHIYCDSIGTVVTFEDGRAKDYFAPGTVKGLWSPRR